MCTESTDGGTTSHHIVTVLRHLLAAAPTHGNQSCDAGCVDVKERRDAGREIYIILSELQGGGGRTKKEIDTMCYHIGSLEGSNSDGLDLT